MAIGFRTGATNSNGGGTQTTLTITIPATVQAGDVILVAFTGFGVTSDTVQASSTGTAPTIVGSSQSSPSFNSHVTNSALFVIVAGASDAGKVITGSLLSGGSVQWAAALGVWTGVSNSSPVDVNGAATAAGNGSTVTCPNKTTGVAGDWDIQIIAATLGGSSYTGGGSLTQRESVSDASSGCTAAIFDSNASVGGSGTVIGGTVFSNTGNNSWWVGFTVGLAPATVNVTGTLSLAMAPMAESVTAAETIRGIAALAMAPMRLSVTAHETGVNVTGTISMAMAPMRMQLSGPQNLGTADYLDDWHHRIWRRRRMLGRMGM